MARLMVVVENLSIFHANWMKLNKCNIYVPSVISEALIPDSFRHTIAKTNNKMILQLTASRTATIMIIAQYRILAADRRTNRTLYSLYLSDFKFSEIAPSLSVVSQKTNKTWLAAQYKPHTNKPNPPLTGSFHYIYMCTTNDTPFPCMHERVYYYSTTIFANFLAQ